MSRVKDFLFTLRLRGTQSGLVVEITDTVRGAADERKVLRLRSAAASLGSG